MTDNISTTKPNTQALTLIELVAVIATLAILATALLMTAKAKAEKSKQIQCVSNLKQLGLAYKTWAVDCSDKMPMGRLTNDSGTREFVLNGQLFRHYQSMSNELSVPKILVCPADERKPIMGFEHLQNENISYFVGVDAADVYPRMLLSGDRNVTNDHQSVNSMLELRPEFPTCWKETIHNKQGNIGLADGSVQQYTSARLQEALHSTGDATNRIALPE